MQKPVLVLCWELKGLALPLVNGVVGVAIPLDWGLQLHVHDTVCEYHGIYRAPIQYATA